MDKWTCPCCQSEDVEPGNIQSTGYIYFRPANSKFISVKTADVRVNAAMCTNCGFIMLVGKTKKVKELTQKEACACDAK